ncbi:hypothetical protein SEUCBS140593_004365 [Sporothrix eucalyptigena]|uniref:Fe2OG dioxygenase domain-containing protein n=1 Tax=Sporothrix eucalyptigena TaxID=1812306 RepID=A0ABP0BMG9_9PEZI
MDDDIVPPPPQPPPLLPPESLHHLCTHGYLGLNLPHHLANQYDQLLAASDAFFAEPAETKRLYCPGTGLGPEHRGPPTSATNTERGYTHIDGEKEYLTLRKSMTHLPPGIYDAAAPLWHDTAHLLHRILGDIGVYLGLGPTAWDGVVSDSLEPSDGFYEDDKKDDKTDKGKDAEPDEQPRNGRARTHPRDDPPTLLRLFRYEPGGGGAEQHRDLGLLTLCVCWGKGLQVLPQIPRRAPGPADDSAPPPPPQPPTPWLDAPRVTVMTGDTLHVLSTNRIPSAQHRVVVDPKEAAGTGAETDGEKKDTPLSESRRSIVFALRATTAGDIDLTNFGGFGSVGARELYDNIRKSRVNINANKETRAVMRAEYERVRGKGKGKEAEQAAEDPKGTGKENGESIDGENTIEGEPVGVA